MSKQSVIKRLDEAVVNRIAAGEVIQRPANAIKEMLENSLDAGATSVSVTIKAGGLKMLQITDNGHGIRKEDLEIVCKRFTTSKLKDFDDLRSITTFGFRGEALASISHVAHLSITTKTSGSQCAYKANYVDGELKNAVRPTAGNDGTQITVEDLFYNIPTRRKAFRSNSEEHQKIADVMTRYAVHNSGISFTLRKADTDAAGTVTVRTQIGASVIDNIRTLYGSTVANEIIPLECEDGKLKLKVSGYITNANCSMKKFNILLFINNRLVDCTALKRALDSVYQTYLPKGGHPFMYLSLKMPACNLDVNVHPTKHEVHFLHEEEVIDSVQSAVDKKLLSCDSSRTFYTQKLLPSVASAQEPAEKKSEGGRKQQASVAATPKPAKVYDHHLVRTDSKLQKLDAFLVRTPTAKHATPPSDKQNERKRKCSESETLRPSEEPSSRSEALTASELPQKRIIRLTSVIQLRDAMKEKESKELTSLLRDHTFVGSIDPELALLQHQTKLYLVNTTALSLEMFYQIMLRDFGNFGMLRLSEPAPIYDLAMLDLETSDSHCTPADGSKENLANYIVKFLSEKAEMLCDYFRLEIKDGCFTGIPMLLQNYVPPLEGLPRLIMRLSADVFWDDEKDCFDSFCREVARFYAVRKGYTDLSELLDQKEAAAQDNSSCGDEAAEKQDAPEDDRTTPSTASQSNSALSWRRTVEHVIFRAMRKHLLVPQRMGDNGTFLELANLPDLYKVFERC